MYDSISQIKRANVRIGHDWFDEGAMSFFNTTFPDATVYAGRYFITADRMEPTDPNRFTIRHADNEGRITTVGDLARYTTLNEARDEARKFRRQP